MTDVNYRMERIERLLNELRYEIEIGMLQGEIEESLGMNWIIPTSKTIPKGIVMCQFKTYPSPVHTSFDLAHTSHLRVVK